MGENIAFDPDHKSIHIRRAKIRVHREMRKRIGDVWPIARQMEVLTGQVARTAPGIYGDLSSDAQRAVDNNAAQFRQMVEEIMQIQLCADLLKRGFDNGTLNPNTFDFSNDKYWKGNR